MRRTAMVSGSKLFSFSSRTDCARILINGIFLTWVLLLQCHNVAPQSVDIYKTVKEELLPGFVITDLAAEPEFVRTVADANVSGAIKKDSSSGTSLQYSVLTSGNPQSQFFTVSETSGIVSIKERIDREKVCSFKEECILSFEVAARSVYGVFFLLVDFYITVLDINDNSPEFTQPQFELFVPENSDKGRAFQLPVAFDRDTGQENGVSEYRILDGPSLFGLKTVETGFNTSDVFLTLQETITMENSAAYKVLVGAVDGGLPQLTGTLTVEVHISDINDNFPVFEQSLYIRKIPEDTGNDQVIEQVKATDADIGPNGELRYSFSALQPPDDLSYFRIDALTGEIFLTRSIESRTGDDIELVVEASDRGHPPKVSRTRVRIQVEDTINSMPEIIIDTLGGSKGVAEVSEYAEIGKVVTYLSVRDPDSGDNGQTSCKLSNQEFGLVRLQQHGKYKVVLAMTLDREETVKYTVTVSCADKGFPSLLAKTDFTVIVLDENDQKPVFSQRTYEATIFENNTAGTFIAQVAATDRDIGKNAEIFYDIIGTNKKFFDIDDAGKIVAKVPLDREYSDKIVATVVATDRGIPPLSSSATVVLTLNDVNDMRPEFSQNVYMFEVEEQQSLGRFVGIISASDKDAGVNQEITYEFLDPDKLYNNRFLLGGEDGVIKTNAGLDREEKDSYQFVVYAVDKGVPPLTGTATVIIKITDVNDNDPYFICPVPENNTITIPHTFEVQRTIIPVLAHDPDAGLNAEICYSINTVNSTSPFDINPTSGSVFIKRKLSPQEAGIYTLILIASDKGPVQRSTQSILYIDVYFDNSTLFLAVGTAGPSKEIITALVVVGCIVFVTVVVCTTVICIKRHQRKSKQKGSVPNSASTSSTTKLHGGYYIAPGIRESSSSFIAKQGEGSSNANIAQDMGDGIRNSNPYVVFLQPHRETEAPSEIIEISRNGYKHGLNDTLNTLDLDQTDDDQFSTFKSQDDILSPGFRKGSLQRQHHDCSISKKTNDTFDDTSCDGSTSDSGRGGSDLDVNNGAAAAKHDKARALAATPISLKSGISHRLSPLLQKEKSFATFRGDSPSSFKFDSDSDTLTRNNSRVSPNPVAASSTMRDTSKYKPGSTSAFSGAAGHLSERDTDTEFNPRNQSLLSPSNISGIYNPSSLANDYNSWEYAAARQPSRLLPQALFIPPVANVRRESETDHSDTGSNPSNSLTRRNHVPRLPLLPGIEFTHPDFGVPIRNNISAFNNPAFPSNQDVISPEYDPGDLTHYYSSHPRIRNDYSSVNNQASGNYHSNNNSLQTNPTIADSYGNIVSEIQESRPVSMDVDFLLPPYPEVDEEEEEENLIIHSGFSGNILQEDVERALISKSRSESTA